MSKDKVVGVLGAKISEVDNNSRKLEKEYTKNGGDMRQFMNNYLKERMDFHKYQILKVKVN